MMIVNNLLTVFVNKSLPAENWGFTKTFRSFSEKCRETSEKTDLQIGKKLSHRQDLSSKSANPDSARRF